MLRGCLKWRAVSDLLEAKAWSYETWQRKVDRQTLPEFFCFPFPITSFLSSSPSHSPLAQPIAGLYSDRIAGGDCDHCHSGWVVAPGSREGEGQGAQNPLHQ